MKKVLALSLGSLIFANSAFALHDLYGFYVNPAIGYNHLNLSGMSLKQDPTIFSEANGLSKTSSSSNGLGYSLAAGYGLENYPIRFEVEYAGQQNVKYNSNPLLASGINGPAPNPQNVSSKITSSHAMANVIIDFHANSYIVPYFKLGAGVAKNKFDLTDNYGDVNENAISQSTSKTQTNFAWQAGVGTAVKVSDNFYVNGEVHYVDLGKAKSGNFYDPEQDGTSALNLSANLQSYQASVGAMWFFGGSRYTAPANAA